MSSRQVWFSFLTALGIAAVILGAAWYSRHRNDPDVQTVAVDTVVAFIPFLASIFFALWPQVNRTHIAWRLAIIFGGLLWSVLLGRQDYLNMQASRRDTQAAIGTAVGNANQHTDQQIAGVKSEVETSAATLNGRIDNMGGQVSKEVSKTDTDITGAIGKVVTPPIKYAQVQFSLFGTDASKYPITAETLSPDENGVFSIDFIATNISDTAASGVELWVMICDQCTFAQEPQGFDKPPGSPDTVRHKVFGQLNPGVSIAQMTAQVKVAPGFSTMEISFKYSCGNCGAIGPPQTARIVMESSFPLVPSTTPN